MRAKIPAVLVLSVFLGYALTPGAAAPPKKVQIAMIPKAVGNKYFASCEKGAKKAAEELGVELLYNGPEELDSAKQIEQIRTWILKKVDAICIAPNDPNAIAPVVKQAKAKGIKVLTWDTDAPKSDRDLMVNQCDGESLGRHAMDVIAQQVGEKKSYAIVIGSLTAENLNFWKGFVLKQNEEKYPDIKMVKIEVSDEKREKAINVTQALLQAHPDLGGIVAVDSVSFPGAAEGVAQAGKGGQVAVTGFSTPQDMKDYVKKGVVKTVILWDPSQLGYLTVKLANELVQGKEIKEGMEIPGFGKITLDKKDPKVVIMSPPMDFTVENIDNFDF